tara:strand:+ start:317 stop:601 length:285 start_codon:yes stop_codon:yes gene_type:complete
MIIYENGIARNMTEAEVTAWNASLPTAEEKLQERLTILRSQRNALLAKTDWTANSDVTMSSAMTTYRQQLRDAPTGLNTVEKVEAYEFPEEVTS